MIIPIFRVSGSGMRRRVTDINSGQRRFSEVETVVDWSLTAGT
jgi:hypothetical protein